LFWPLFGDVHGDLVEEIALVEGGFAGGLDEADDAFGVGRDEEREVGGGELCDGGGGNDESWGTAKLLGCGLRWLGRGGLIVRRFSFCEGWFRWAFGWGSDRRGRLCEEGVEVDLVGFPSVYSVERRQDLLGQADALGTPFGEQEENGRGAVVIVDARGLAYGKEGERERNGGKGCAEKCVLTAGLVDGNGVVGYERCGQSSVQFGYGFCSGLRIIDELLERGEGEAAGVESMDGDRGLDRCRGRGGSRISKSRKEDGLTGRVESDGLRREGELEIVERSGAPVKTDEV
jgi:hypothetical protein